MIVKTQAAPERFPRFIQKLQYSEYIVIIKHMYYKLSVCDFINVIIIKCVFLKYTLEFLLVQPVFPQQQFNNI